MKEVNLRAFKSLEQGTVNFYLTERRDGAKFYAGELAVIACPVGEKSDIRPFLRIDWECDHIFQQLMDDLWAMGVRPTEGAGSAGAMAATQKHLEDMRTLVFNRQEVKK